VRSFADVASGSEGTSSSSSKAQVESASSTSEEKKEDKPMGWGIFFAYMGCGVATVSFLYYFYKARYSFHQTEILIVDALRRLPMYWPPSPHDGEINARTDAEGLPEDIKLAFCEWFVVTDLEEAKGVTRDDVLELMHELGYSDKAQPAKDFLFRGEGHIEEKRRLTCAALQESLTLLCALRADAEKKLSQPKPEAPKEGEELPTPKSDVEALDILRRKFRRSASVLNSAEQLRQATAGVPVMPSPPTVPATETDPEASAAPPLEEPKDIDESEDRRLEDLRLARLEDELLSRLERLGSLSLAEESRLNDLRRQRAAIKAS